MKKLFILMFLIGCGSSPKLPFEHKQLKSEKYWNDLVIPYEHNVDSKTITIIDKAMKEWSSKTGITFVKHTVEKDFVTFVSGYFVCQSNIGKIGGQQLVTLSPQCDYSNALHELGHVLGLEHEQSRADRDEYVVVHLEEIKEGMSHNFDKVSSYKPSTPYDYNSIMHYDSFDFSKDSKPVLLTVNNLEIHPPGVLTIWDVQKVLDLYHLTD